MTKCKECESGLKLGSFMHNQELCWDCFKKETDLMLERIDQYPSWLWNKKEEHKDILKYLVACMRELFDTN